MVLLLQRECPSCLTAFSKNCEAYVMPCSQGHLICHKCLTNNHCKGSRESKDWLFKADCPKERHCVECATCHDICHLSESNIKNALKVPKTEEDLTALKIREAYIKKRMEDCALELKKRSEETVKILVGLKKDLNKHEQNCRIAKITGSAVAISGGVIFIIGGIASAMTLGAASPLMIIGAGISTAGGGTSGGTCIASSLINKAFVKDTNDLWMKVERVYKELVELVQEYKIIKSLQVIGLEEHLNDGLALSAAGVVLGVLGVASMITTTWHEAATVAETALLVGALAVRVVATVAAGVLVVFSLIQLIWNLKDLGKAADFSGVIDNVIWQIEAHCISLADTVIEIMDLEVEK